MALLTNDDDDANATVPLDKAYFKAKLRDASDDGFNWYGGTSVPSARGAQVDAEAPGGDNGMHCTALIEAARLGMVDAVQRLVARGARVDHETVEGNTALIIAAKEGNLRLLVALVDAKANVNYETKGNHTALTAAAQAGKVDAMARPSLYSHHHHT